MKMPETSVSKARSIIAIRACLRARSQRKIMSLVSVRMAQPYARHTWLGGRAAAEVLALLGLGLSLAEVYVSRRRHRLLLRAYTRQGLRLLGWRKEGRRREFCCLMRCPCYSRMGDPRLARLARLGPRGSKGLFPSRMHVCCAWWHGCSYGWWHHSPSHGQLRQNPVVVCWSRHQTRVPTPEPYDGR